MTLSHRTLLTSATVAGTAIAGWSAAAPRASATQNSALLALPVGPTPPEIAYGIGHRIYRAGTYTDATATFSALVKDQSIASFHREFNDVTIVRGTTVFGIAVWGVDPIQRLGHVSSGRPILTGYGDSYAGIAGVSGGFISAGDESSVPGTARVLTVYGKDYPPQYSMPTAYNGGFLRATGAGSRFVFTGEVEINPYVPRTSWLVHPGGSRPQKLAHPTVYGAGDGWVVIKTSATGYRVASAAAPDVPVSPVIGSQILPLVNDAGTKVLVMQGYRLRVYAVASGRHLFAATAPTLPSFGATQWYAPLTWSGDTVLVNARSSDTLAVVRVNGTTGATQRVVTSFVRTGVTRIVCNEARRLDHL